MGVKVAELDLSMTPKDLSERASTMTFDEVRTQVAPLIGKFVRSWNIPGMSDEDIEQELLIVLHRIHSKFDPRKASFLHYLIMCMENKLGSLLGTYSRRHLQVMYLECETEDCDETVTARARGGTCVGCGSSRWNAVRDKRAPRSLDALDDDVDDFGNRKNSKLRPADPRAEFAQPVVDSDFIDGLLVNASTEAKEIALRIMDGDKVPVGDVRRLRSELGIVVT